MTQKVPTTSKELYEILEAADGEDKASVKSKFRKLAMRLHPDRNPDNKEAAERFTYVSKAWAIIDDPEKLKKFKSQQIDFDGNDLTGAAMGGVNPFNPGADNLKEMFDSFGSANDIGDFDEDATFTSRRDKPAPKASLDLQCRVRLDFVSAATGTKLNVKLPNDKQVKVSIKPGVENGQKLKLAGFGKTGGDRTGDAFLEVVVGDHEYFTRDGNDIGLEVPVTLGELLRQDAIEIPTVHGAVKVTPPLGEAFGKAQRLAGRGINGGDQVITYRLVLPSQVSDEVKQALRGTADGKNPRAHFKL
jgi:DnaJ-class molecular chaperone